MVYMEPLKIDYRVEVSIGYGVYGTSEERPMVEHILDSRPRRPLLAVYGPAPSGTS